MEYDSLEISTSASAQKAETSINSLINNQKCEVHPAHINEEGIEYCMIDMR